MTSNQAITSGSQSQKNAASTNRLNSSNSFQDIRTLPGTLSDPAFFNLFQDLFQKPPAVEVSKPVEDQIPVKEKPDAPKEEDSRPEAIDRPKNVDPEKNTLDDLYVTLPYEIPAHLVDEPEIKIHHPIQPVSYDQPTSVDTEVVLPENKVGLENELPVDLKEPENSVKDVEKLIQKLVGNEAVGKKSQQPAETLKPVTEVDAKPKENPINDNKIEDSIALKGKEPSKADSVESKDLPISGNKVEQKPVEKTTVAQTTEEPVSESTDAPTESKEKKSTKSEGTIFDRTSKQGGESRSSRDLPESEKDAGSIDRLRQQQSIATAEKSEQELKQLKIKRFESFQGGTPGDVSRLPGSSQPEGARNVIQSGSQLAGTKNVLKAGQFQVTGLAPGAGPEVVGGPEGSGPEQIKSADLGSGNFVKSERAGKPKSTNQPSAARVPSSELVNRLSGLIRQAPKGNSNITLQVTPVELGAIELSISVSNGIVNAKAVAENVDAQRLLLEGLDSLKSRLADQGLTVDRFEVELGSQSDFSQSQSGASSGEAFFGQTASGSSSGNGGQNLPRNQSQSSDIKNNNESEQTPEPKNVDGKWAVDVVV